MKTVIAQVNPLRPATRPCARPGCSATAREETGLCNAHDKQPCSCCKSTEYTCWNTEVGTGKITCSDCTKELPPTFRTVTCKQCKDKVKVRVYGRSKATPMGHVYDLPCQACQAENRAWHFQQAANKLMARAKHLRTGRAMKASGRKP